MFLRSLILKSYFPYQVILRSNKNIEWIPQDFFSFIDFKMNMDKWTIDTKSAISKHISQIPKL